MRRLEMLISGDHSSKRGGGREREEREREEREMGNSFDTMARA
jgi:hypothetical protein